MKTLMKKQEELRKMQMKVKEISDKVLALREKYTESVNMKEGLRQECETLELKSERAKSLVDGLGGERDRWEISIGVLETALGNLVGDRLVRVRVSLTLPLPLPLPLPLTLPLTITARGRRVGDGGRCGRVSHLHPGRVGALLLFRRFNQHLQIAPTPERPQTGVGISGGQGLRERRLQHAPLERPPRPTPARRCSRSVR
jgi:hypothetical protein